MESPPSSPDKPGWYWDPWELDYNLALRDQWRQQILLTSGERYRLRRWDGRTWTADTLRDYTQPRSGPMPHIAGPTLRRQPGGPLHPFG